jgi:hypothetical protein
VKLGSHIKGEKQRVEKNIWSYGASNRSGNRERRRIFAVTGQVTGVATESERVSKFTFARLIS